MEKEKEEKTKEIEPVAKSLTIDERKKLLIEGIIKTAFPAFISAVFAIVFSMKFGDAKEGVSWFSVLLLVVLLSYYIQRFLYPVFGIRVKEFEIKDWLYVEFLTVIYFMVFWTLLLNN